MPEKTQHVSVLLFTAPEKYEITFQLPASNRIEQKDLEQNKKNIFLCVRKIFTFLAIILCVALTHTVQQQQQKFH
jgi:hypothetical protein